MVAIINKGFPILIQNKMHTEKDNLEAIPLPKLELK